MIHCLVDYCYIVSIIIIVIPIMDKNKKEVKIVDVTIPGDLRVNEREVGKIERNEMLRNKIENASVSLCKTLRDL